MSSLALKPRMSEKTYEASKAGVYVFDVPTDVNKNQVSSAVEEQFKVNVTNVRVLVAKGKTARSIRLGGIRRQVEGKRPDIKKAYVTLKKGDEIPIFAEVEKAEAEELKAQEKADKKAKKTAKKTSSTTKASKPKSKTSSIEKVAPAQEINKAKGPEKKESFARRFFRRRGGDK